MCYFCSFSLSTLVSQLYTCPVHRQALGLTIYIHNINTSDAYNVADEYLSDDTSSQSSLLSGKYSNLNYYSNDDHDSDSSPIKRNQHNSTRFCHVEKSSTGPTMAHKQGKAILKSPQATTSKDKSTMERCRLTRNRSLVDMRSQLLHRSLVEEVNKRRLFKTVGAVEDIGFKVPCEVSNKPSKGSRPVSSTASAKTISEGKKYGYKGRRV